MADDAPVGPGGAGRPSSEDAAPSTAGDARDRSAEARFERGHGLVGQVNGARGEGIVDDLGDLGRYIVEFAYGDVYARPGLSLRDRALVTVGILAALGGREPQLDVHLAGALRHDLTPQELEEVMIHVAPYAGFPAAMNGLARLKAVLAAADANAADDDDANADADDA